MATPEPRSTTRNKWPWGKNPKTKGPTFGFALRLGFCSQALFCCRTCGSDSIAFHSYRNPLEPIQAGLGTLDGYIRENQNIIRPFNHWGTFHFGGGVWSSRCLLSLASWAQRFTLQKDLNRIGFRMGLGNNHLCTEVGRGISPTQPKSA